MDVKALVQAMSLEERAGQLLMEDFVGRWELPAEMAAALSSGSVGSVLYFSGCNVVDAFQLRALNEEVLRASRESPHGIPAFTALDQEGGQLAPVYRAVSVHPGNMALGAISGDNVSVTRELGAAVGKELKAIGVTMCFAPVVDLAHEEGSPVKDNRYFGSDPEKTGVLAAAFIEGLQSQGVMGCAKHFPGQRNVEIDSHFALDVVPYGLERLESKEFIPFRKAIGAGVGAMMTLHAAYPELDPSGVPATLSRPIMTGLLRERLGFKGLIITDDIQMKPVIDAYGLEGAFTRAIEAGINLIIVSKAVRDANRMIAAAVRSGKLSEDRLNEACLKVLEEKAKFMGEEFGKAGAKRFSFPDRPAKASDRILEGGEARVVEEAVRTAADRSITLVRNSGGVLPLVPGKSISPRSRIALIHPPFARLVMSDATDLYAPLAKEAFSPYLDGVIEYCVSTDPDHQDILAVQDLAFVSDYTIYCTYNAYAHPKQIEALEAARSLSKDERFIVLVLRSPADLNVIPAWVPAILLSYGAAPVNMEAAARTITGRNPPSGRLPVSPGKDWPRGAGLSGF